MTPDKLMASLSLRSVVGMAFHLPGGAQLRALVVENIRAGHPVAVAGEVRGPGVCYRLTVFRAE